MKVTSPFSYYGGKSKLAHIYPPPSTDIVIEPFAGSAAYAFRYWEREVWINDADPQTFAIWQFLTSHNAGDTIERLVPSSVQAGFRVTDLIPDDAHPGLVGLLQAEANQGTQGTGPGRNVITDRGAAIWTRRLKRKLLDVVVPRVKHWAVTNDHYREMPDLVATWFVDPPYANAAGARYRTHDVDFNELADWCQDRVGLVIVCENEGATWLPFQVVSDRRGFKSDHQKSTAREVMWVQENRALRRSVA